MRNTHMVQKSEVQRALVVSFILNVLTALVVTATAYSASNHSSSTPFLVGATTFFLLSTIVVFIRYAVAMLIESKR